MVAQWNVSRVWTAFVLILSLALGGCAGGGGIPGFSVQDQIDALMTEGQQLYAGKNYDGAIAKFGEVVAKDGKYWQAYVGIARSYIAKGNWADAIANGKKAYELSPKGQDVIPVLGQALYGGGADALKNGRLQESVSRFTEYLKLEPGNTSAWLNVGKAFLGQSQFREALNAFTQGLANGGGADRAELIRGLLDGGMQAFSRNDFRGAIDLLREYLKFDSKNLSAYLNLAKAYWESGDRGAAVDAFRKVLEIDPRQTEALRFLLR